MAARKRSAPARTSDHDCVPRDSVDALVSSWQDRRPDLEWEPIGVVTRLSRVRSHIDVELERVFSEHDLTPGAFAALVTLARLDDGGGVGQRRLGEELGASAAAIAARYDGLVERGLVGRDGHAGTPEDGEPVLALTDQGRELFDRMAPVHLANERRLLAALSADERALLTTLLRKLLVEFEGSRPAAAGDAVLGLTVAPAHVTAELREVVGLPPAAGLLVRSVDRGGPAGAAGLRTGDVLLRAGGRELRSVAALYAALGDAGGRVELAVLRGIDEHEVALDLPDGAAPDGARAASPGRAAYAEHVL